MEVQKEAQSKEERLEMNRVQREAIKRDLEKKCEALLRASIYPDRAPRE
jgi:hypothetical protein